MTNPKRPRVAIIGLTEAQAESIAPLCGEPRQANTLPQYLANYNLSETDIVVATNIPETLVDTNVNLLLIGPTSIEWQDRYPQGAGRIRHHFVERRSRNTERELAVTPECPEVYKSLSADLTRLLIRTAKPSDIFVTSREAHTSLISTTSGLPIALRIVFPNLHRPDQGVSLQSIALVLPETANLVAWFRAFLLDLHEVDPLCVPQQPPRLSQPSVWYTPEERNLALRISQIDHEVERLIEEQNALEVELFEEGQKADKSTRRVLWTDGDELATAVGEVFSAIGFNVRDMDSELRQDEPKREDIRLTLPGMPGWEAIVEVKGYTNGTRTNDADQIRRHRERYALEECRLPNLTIWISNPYRSTDPSSRPAPDKQVEQTAQLFDAVLVLSTDLYRQWAQVAAGMFDAGKVVESLMNAHPGIWNPPASTSNT